MKGCFQGVLHGLLSLFHADLGFQRLLGTLGFLGFRGLGFRV